MRQVSSNGTLSMNERKGKNTPSFLRCQSASAVNTPTMYALNLIFMQKWRKTCGPLSGGFYYAKKHELEGNLVFQNLGKEKS